MRYLAPPSSVSDGRGSRPRFSVVIPAFQAAATVGEAVESALAQTVAPLEVIVCDDGSTDALDAVLAPYRRHVVVLRKEHGGVSSARNAGVRAASGEFVSFLDADDAFFPERLEALGDLAAERPDLDIVTTDAFFEVGGRRVGRFYSAQHPFPTDDQRVAILERCFLFAPAVRLRRLLEVGGFDESISVGEDWECWMRILFSGGRAGLVDGALISYRLHEGSLTSDRARAMQERVRILEKTRSSVTLTATETKLVERLLRRRRARAALIEAEASLRQGAPGGRWCALRLLVAPGHGVGTRAKALAAALAPEAAGRRLAAREARTGASRLRKALPDGREIGRTP